MSRTKATLKIDSIAAYTRHDKKVVIDWDFLDGDKELKDEELSSAFLYENLETFLDAVDCSLEDVENLLGRTVTAKLYKSKNNAWLVDPLTVKLLNPDEKPEEKVTLVASKPSAPKEKESSIRVAADSASAYDEGAANSARLLNKYLHDTIKHINILIDKGFELDDVGKTIIKLYTDASYLEFKLNSLKDQK